MATSSSSSAVCNWLYDVFPSFSGEDVRRTFLSHLLLALNRRLIISFRDNEIERSQSIGSELVHGIRDSRIAIVVFSVRYASSSWCLNELLEIVKCKEEKGQMVIPIFYALDPSHVRKQAGEFGKAFRKTCESKSDEVQIRWKRALTDVANIHGYHSENWDNEANLIEDITNDVLGKLSLTSSMEFGDFVGIEDHMAEMSSLLSLESEEVRMVGIWGPSGIGKTIIARALFTRLSRHFQGSVFIDRAFISKTMEIYRRANPDDYNMKLHLQRNFLSEILNKKDIKIHHLDAVGERLKHHKVLITLDDLDDQVVLDALAGGIQWFGCGSRVIVITKDKHVLRAHGIDPIYEMGLPSDKQALEMFCRYAFRQNSPCDGFKELASEVTKLAGSLPLGLKVLGMYLRGRDKEDWLDMLPRLRKVPDKKILRALRASYDELGSKEDKEIFRHIACLFNGMETNDIKLLLADSGLNVNIGLKNLEDKSLIHVRWNTIRVHRLLEQVGKEIVRAQSNKPQEREFLVDLKNIYDVLNSNSGIRKVVGISLNLAEFEELVIDKEVFKRIRNLRFLRIYKDSLALHKQVRLLLPGGLDYFPPKLKSLCWDEYPMRYLPSSFSAEHLIVLRMRNSNLEKLWEEVQSPTCLEDMVEEIVEAPSSVFRNLKDIPDVTNLEKSDLNSLVEIPTSVGKIRYLNKIYMGDSIDLEALSTNINIKSLYRLDLSGCSQFKSFPNISNNISFLLLNQTAIREVPRWIENFSRLICLEMQECKRLEYISPNISKLRFLEKADFSNCRALTDASWIDHPSTMAMEANDVHTKLPVLSFINCFKLDQESLIQQSVFKYLILPGGEVPSYFTNRATGSSVTIHQLQSSLTQQFVGFRACLEIDADEPKHTWNGPITSSRICCHLTGKEGNLFDSTDCHIAIDVPCQMNNHLVIFDCRFTLEEDKDSLSELNYNLVDLEINFTIDSLCKIKGCGIRLSEACSSPNNQPSYPNFLPHVCEADERDITNDGGHENGHGKECADSNAERKRSRKRMRIMGSNTQETIDLLCS